LAIRYSQPPFSIAFVVICLLMSITYNVITQFLMLGRIVETATAYFATEQRVNDLTGTCLIPVLCRPASPAGEED
jgi:hypothetical protein